MNHPTGSAQSAALMIDRAGSRDRDDAIEVIRLAAGWRLTVYIADVASGVPAGSDVDRVALQRRESAYGGPRGVQAMLPRPVEDRRTLAEGRVCPAVAVHLEVSPDGTCSPATVERTEVDHLAALDHAEVAAAVDDPGHRHHRALREAAVMAEVLLERRRDRGALAIYDLLAGWATGEEGGLVRLGAHERTIGYVIVQECMIAANTGLAAWAAAADLPLLFRNHGAAAVAPPRHELQADLDAAVADRRHATTRLESLLARTELTLRPAEYAPHMGGHWGLNLPGYVHATSPLRRYADLVVQRIILAHLDGAAPAYPAGRLAEIADALNTGARLDRDAESSARKSRAHGVARRRAASERADFSRLDAAAFHGVLKRGCKESIAGQPLVEETVRRARAGRLTTLELQLVMLVAGGSGWDPARTACLEGISRAPETAMSVLSVHSQTGGTPLPEFSASPHPAGLFVAQATWPVGDRPCGAARVATTKKGARYQAALSLLAALTGLPDPSRDCAIPALPQQAPPPAAGAASPVSVLHEYQQQGRIRGLDFAMEVRGPVHQPVFHCTARAVHEGRDLAVGGDGTTKAAAKSAAAATLLVRIERAPDWVQ